MPEVEINSAVREDLQYAKDTCAEKPADFRFGPEDVTDSLRRGANAYARTYVGTFAFMVDMKRQALRSQLTVMQAKGVLNCMLAEVRRERQNQAAAEQPQETVDMSALMTLFQRAGQRLRNPRITLQLNGRPLTLKLMTRGAHPGAINVQSGNWPNGIWYGRVNPDGSLMQTRFMREDALELIRELGEDPVAAARRYASLSGNCCFCNLPLTTPESTTAGYGPVCAQHYGLPWGTVIVQDEAHHVRRRRTPQVAALPGMTPLGLSEHPFANGDGVEASELGWAAGEWPINPEIRGIRYTLLSREMGGEDEAELMSVTYISLSGRRLNVYNE